MAAATEALEGAVNRVYNATTWETPEDELATRLADATKGLVPDGDALAALLVEAVQSWFAVRRDRANDAAGIVVMERLRARPEWTQLSDETRLVNLFHLGRSLWNNAISRMVDSLAVWNEYLEIATRRGDTTRIAVARDNKAWSTYFAVSRAAGFDEYAALFRESDPDVVESQLDNALASWRQLAGWQGNEAQARYLESLGASVYAIHVALCEEAAAGAWAGPDGIVGTADDLADNPRLAAAVGDLDALVGLDQVKHEVRRLVAFLRLQRARERAGGAPTQISNHMVFLGPPGTGKTTVARLMGRIFYALGVLESDRVTEVSRADLVAEYIGQTAPRVNEVIDKALGGVLFIDEAYALFSASDRDFGREAVSTLLKRMEDARDRLVVIVAGYTKPMLELLDSNPGLDSRFRHRFRFDAYDVDALATIFRHQCAASGYVLADEAGSALDRACRDLVAGADVSFGNARAVRNLFESVLIEQATRLGAGPADPAVLSVIDASDIQRAMGSGPRRARTLLIDEQELAGVLAELDALVGIEAVKRTVHRLVDVLRISALRADHGLPAPRSAPHMVFLGPPGTGKTTVARLMGRVLHGLGLLRTARVVEATRGDLVGRYVGETAIRTDDLIDRALDGVLFIDEAYAIVPQGDGAGSNDYGQEALATLIKRMEDDRDRLVVILAGYAERMQRLLDANPGLPSRIGTTVSFEAYDADELVAVFASMAERAGYQPDAGGVDRLGLVTRLIASQADAGGNAREVRRLLDGAIARQASRLGAQRLGGREPTVDELRTLTRDDVVWDGLGEDGGRAPVDARRTAVHELGHALVGWYLRGAPAPVYVTIRPHGQTLGRAFYDLHASDAAPDRAGMVQVMATALGGYVAEEVVLGAPSVGAGSDLERAVAQARAAIASGLGVTDARGSLAAVVRASRGGADDADVETLVGEAYDAARTVVTGHVAELTAAADELVRRLALDATDLERLLGPRPAQDALPARLSSLQADSSASTSAACGAIASA